MGGGGARCCALIFLPNLHKVPVPVFNIFFEAEKRNSAHFIKGPVMCRFFFLGGGGGGSFSLKREAEMSTLRSPKEFIITSWEENKAVRLSCIAHLGL